VIIRLCLTPKILSIRIIQVFALTPENHNRKICIPGREGGAQMATNLAEEIKEVEAESKQIVSQAKSEAVKIVSDSKNESERRVKEAKQEAYRNYRNQVTKVEEQAEEKAQKVVSDGQAEAKSLEKKHKDKLKSVGAWIAEEVMAKYGRS